MVGALAADRMSEWRAGRTIRAPAQMRAPSCYLDPGVPDQRRVLARRGIALVGTVKSGALVESRREAAHSPSPPRRFVRSREGRSFRQSAAGYARRGIVTAIVIGDRSGLDDSVERRLQEAGTYHVIAISGGNIAILAGLTLVVFRMAGLLGRGAMFTAMAGLVAYGYLVGGSVGRSRDDDGSRLPGWACA